MIRVLISLCASRHGHVEVVECLIRNGADIDLQDSDGWTSLNIASENGHLDVVKCLLYYGASPFDNENSITLAAENGHQDIVQVLKIAGENAKNAKARTRTGFFSKCTTVTTL